jgi:hypothetical protein
MAWAPFSLCRTEKKKEKCDFLKVSPAFLHSFFSYGVRSWRSLIDGGKQTSQQDLRVFQPYFTMAMGVP